MLESKWGLRFVALALALFMFLSVNNVFDELLNVDSDTADMEIIEDVPVEILYEEEDYYVSGAPEQVNVQLFGNASNIKRLQTTRDLTVYLDLRNRDIGEYEEHFTIEGLPENVTAEIVPEAANVDIQELVTKTFEVQAEVSDSRIGSDHELKSITVEPETITVVGGESQMNRIQYVRATLSDNSKITEDRVEEAEVSVFDAQFNKLDVKLDPGSVRVEIKVDERSKEVPVSFEVNGQVKKGYSLKSVDLNYEMVEVFGSEDVLSGIDEMNVDVDIDGLSQTTSQDVKIALPENVDRTEPAVLQAKIQVEENS